MGDKVLTNILLNAFIVMTLVIFSINVQRRAKKRNHKLIMLKPTNHCCSWHMLIMQRRWNMRKSQETIFQNLILLKLINAQLDETTWFLDSGCSNHMFGHKDFFSELDESFRKSVKLGDNSSIDVMGKGRIHLQVKHVSQVISEVFYIPELKNNLLSIGQL